MKKSNLVTVAAIIFSFLLLVSISCKKDELSPEQEKFEKIKDKVHLTFKINGVPGDISKKSLYYVFNNEITIETRDTAYQFRVVIPDKEHIFQPDSQEFYFGKYGEYSTSNQDTAFHVIITEYNETEQYIKGTFYGKNLKNGQKPDFTVTEGSFLLGRYELRYAK